MKFLLTHVLNTHMSTRVSRDTVAFPEFPVGLIIGNLGALQLVSEEGISLGRVG